MRNVFLSIGILAASSVAHANDGPSAYSLVASCDKRCGSLTSIINRGKSDAFSRMEGLGRQLPLKHELPESLRATRLEDFDFDNDGVTDQVYFDEEFTTYQKATVWYVFRGPLSLIVEETRAVTAMTVYPCQFDSSVLEAGDCAPISQNADEASFNVSVPGSLPTVAFRARYTYVYPVITGHKTLLLLTSSSLDTEEYAAAIEPTGKQTYHSLCLFKRTIEKSELNEHDN